MKQSGGMILRSLLFAVAAAYLAFLAESSFQTSQFLDDVGGLSAFLTVFGTLYGILAAFVVFEVWIQFNQISELIDKEAQGLERLYRLTLYFRDDDLTARVKQQISDYVNQIIEGKFSSLAAGARNEDDARVFRQVADSIRNIEFDDDHDSIVFDHILGHYGDLSQIRTERLNQSLSRLPTLLKTFIYVSSFFALVTFFFMPFAQPAYAVLSVLIIAFVQAMVVHIIEDLDNPFAGVWRLTTEPFERSLHHIERNY